MATCRKCMHWDKCSKKDGTTRFYGKDIACDNAEKLCEWFISGEEIERLRAEKEHNANEEKYILSTVMVAPIEYTVRKMQERLKAECNKYLLHSGITLMLHQHIDQIAKEMLEGVGDAGE